MTRFAFPVVWGNDNGPEQRNRLTEALAKLYGTRKEYSMTYSSQKQGQVERKNRTILAELQAKVLKFGFKWSTFLPWIESTYNSTPHPATGFSPYQLMFGRLPRIPAQTILPFQPLEKKGWSNNSQKYWKEIQSKMAKFHEMRKENIARYHATRYPARPDQLDPPFEVGDQVMKYLPRKKNDKLFEICWAICH